MADASKLYIDPTPAYKPTLDFLTNQEKAANTRYGKNKADISNIFGTLTSLTEKDAARIEDQFVQSIQQQQQGLAQRTAEVRTTQGTARQAMQDVGAERGGGPVGGGPTAVDAVAEEGIARSNEYQTTWDALMNANKLQAQENLRNRVAGFGQQQATALTTLQQNLEARLSELGGSRAGVESDIAKAKLQGQQTVASAKYSTDVAKEAAATAKADLATQRANAPVTYPKSRTGWSQEYTDKGGDPKAFMDAVEEMETLIREKENISDKLIKIPKSMMIKYWMNNPAYESDELLSYALEYFDKYAGLG
jgi:hypothetical protein